MKKNALKGDELPIARHDNTDIPCESSPSNNSTIDSSNSTIDSKTRSVMRIRAVRAALVGQIKTNNLGGLEEKDNDESRSCLYRKDVDDKLLIELNKNIRFALAACDYGIDEVVIDTESKRLCQLFSGLSAPLPQMTASIPQSWAEAKAQVPDLAKWSEVKEAADREGRKLIIIDHLRDAIYGYGKWTGTPPGLPRNMLNKWDDHAAYEALYSWLRGNPLPPDVHLPAEKRGRKPLPPQAVDPEELKAAYRLIKRAESARKRS